MLYVCDDFLNYETCELWNKLWDILTMRCKFSMFFRTYVLETMFRVVPDTIKIWQFDFLWKAFNFPSSNSFCYLTLDGLIMNRLLSMTACHCLLIYWKISLHQTSYMESENQISAGVKILNISYEESPHPPLFWYLSRFPLSCF